MADPLYSDIRPETFNRIYQIDEFNLTQVDRGVLSIHAPWSGQSIMHGKSILNLIDISEFKDFAIYIVDIDSISQEKQVELIGTICHGFFESVWIENGKVEFNYRDGNRATELAKFKDYLNQRINKFR